VIIRSATGSLGNINSHDGRYDYRQHRDYYESYDLERVSLFGVTAGSRPPFVAVSRSRVKAHDLRYHQRQAMLAEVAVSPDTVAYVRINIFDVAYLSDESGNGVGDL
jgi:hypothetical protein